MALNIFKKNKNQKREELEKELRVLRAQMAVLEEAKEARKQAEEKLRDSEGIYQSLVESLHQNVMRKDLNGRFTFVNHNFCKILGKKEEEILGKTDFDFYPKELATKYTIDDKKAIKEGKALEYIEENELPGGKRIFVKVIKSPVYNSKKEVIGVQIIFWDITESRLAFEELEKERKLAKQKLSALNESLERQIDERTKKLKESEEKYRKLIEIANDAIFVANPETGTIIDANKQAEKLLGLPKEKIIGMNQSELHPKEEVERYKKAFLEHVKNGGGISEELFVCNKNGEKIPVEISASVIEIGGQKIIQGIFRDLRRWKQSEEIRSQLVSIVTSSNDAITSWSLDHINISWNPSAERIFGFKASEINGKPVDIIVPAERKDELKIILEKIKNGERIENYETVRLRKDKKPIDVLLTISPVRDASGKIVGLSSIARDVTEHKKLLATLEKVKKEEEQRKELQTIEKLASSPQTDTLTQLFGFTSLSKSFPDVFKDMVDRYERLLDLAVEEAETKTDSNVSDELLFLGKQLGFLRAGPKDVLEIHSTTIKRKNGNLSPAKTQSYTEAGRRTALELMSHLATYYRNFTMSTKKINVVDDHSEKVH